MSTSEDDAATTAYKSDAEEEKPITKREKMRLMRREQWLNEELRCLDPCSGAPKPKMRLWFTQLRAARKRFPTEAAQPISPEKSTAHVMKHCMQQLIVAKCTGDHLEAVDHYYEEFPRSTDVSRLLSHLQDEFLWIDDKDAIVQ